MAELRRLPIHRALNRPDLMMGCERELWLSLGTICIALIMVGKTLVSISLAIALWMVGSFVLRKMAKADPFLSKVYQRHIQYKSYYPARSTPWAESATHKR